MSSNYISVKIEGEFINSYIYSGTLFLVDVNAQVSTYDWNALLSDVLLHNPELLDFLKDARKQLTIIPQENIDICHTILNEKKTSYLSLGITWPNDISLFANYLYIADQNGLKKIGFDWKQHKIIPDKKYSMWNKYTYNISPTNFKRLAISTGRNGIITFIPKKQGADDFETKTIEVISYDCDWSGTHLIANMDQETLLLTYTAITALDKNAPAPDKEKYWKEFGIKMQTPPKEEKIKSVEYSWIAGNRLLSLSNDGAIEIRDFDSKISDKNIVPSMSIAKLLIESSVMAAKSGSFGTAMEIGDQLLLVTEKGIEDISRRPVNWRTFPRSKSYYNQLHIIEDTCIEIRAYITSDESHADCYGISSKDISEET